MRKVLFILGQLNDSDADWLANNGTRTKVPQGTELIKFASRIDWVYIVLDGSLRVCTGNGVQLAISVSGDMLGEMSLIDSNPTAASVRAEQDSWVLALPKQLLVEKLKVDIGFAARFYRAISLLLADRMRNYIQRMAYGKDGDVSLPSADIDELEPDVLDNVHLAGARFDRMLKRFAR